MNSISNDAQDKKSAQHLNNVHSLQAMQEPSRSFLLKNLEHNLPLLASRFPQLYEILHFADYDPNELLNLVPCSYTLSFALKRRDVLTLSVNAKNIHSKYDPIQEAEKMKNTLVEMRASVHVDFCFFGLGLGYLHELFIKENKKIKLAIIEPDIFIFILFLASRQLDTFFTHNSLILVPASAASETHAILDSLNLNTYNSFYLAPSLEVSSAWLKEFKTLQERSEKKHALNYNTLKKFYIRWFKNFIKNIDISLATDGVSVLKNIASSFPALVVAAGPSLDSQLPLIKEKQDELIIIAVDTSLKAVLNHGIVPDFVVLMDGQYLNYLHIAQVPSSIKPPIIPPILITEATVYPQVFREKFGSFYLASSFFPLARYIEDFVEMKGHLVAGGSVATTAWDFARFIGCSTTIMAGLDLAFTQKKTHASYCHFETEAMMTSNRFNTIEGANYRMLDMKNTSIGNGYEGDVLTDSKMMMFAWWFESKIEEYPETRTFNLMARGFKIPNMPALSAEDFLVLLEENTKTSDNKKILLNSLLKKRKNVRHVREEKLALLRIFNKIYFQFKAMLLIVDEAIEAVEGLGKASHTANTPDSQNQCEEYIFKMEASHERLKRSELYKTSGFDVVIKVIEKEMHIFETASNAHTSHSSLKKIAEHYKMLRCMLENSYNFTSYHKLSQLS